VILQDTFQKHTVEAIEIRPRQLTSANASHDGLARIFCSIYGVTRFSNHGFAPCRQGNLSC